jgi:hypothetical protein
MIGLAVRPFAGRDERERMAVRLFSRAAIIHRGAMMRFDPTAERWRYDVRLFLLAYVLGIIAFSALIP